MADKISEITTNDIIIICFLVIAIFLILISHVKNLILLYYIFLNFSTAIEFADVEFLKNLKWHFGGCLTYTSATLRVAVKHPPNKLTKLG